MKIFQSAILASGTALLLGCSSAPNSVKTWQSKLSHTNIGEETLAYRTYGDKSNPAVIMLHGLPTSSYLYRNIAPEVASKGYYVITPDLIGFGGSSKPSDFSVYDVQAQSARIAELLRQLNVSRYNVVAHDLGGLVGFELLAANSNTIQSFLVLNTTAYKEGFTPPPEMGMLAGWMGKSMGFMMANRMSGPFLTSKFIKDNMGHPDQLSQEAKENYWWPMHEGTTYPMRATAKSFDKIMARYPIYQEAMKNYTGPSRILWGSKDSVLQFDKLTPQFSRDLKLSPERVQQVSDAGHFIQEDHPKIVTDNILLLLEETKAVAAVNFGF